MGGIVLPYNLMRRAKTGIEKGMVVTIWELLASKPDQNVDYVTFDYCVSNIQKCEKNAFNKALPGLEAAGLISRDGERIYSEEFWRLNGAFLLPNRDAVAAASETLLNVHDYTATDLQHTGRVTFVYRPHEGGHVDKAIAKLLQREFNPECIRGALIPDILKGTITAGTWTQHQVETILIEVTKLSFALEKYSALRGLAMDSK